MGEVQGQPLVADLNDDGWPEVLAADVRGSVALFNIHGEEIWERHLRSMISQVCWGGGCGRVSVQHEHEQHCQLEPRLESDAAGSRW
jgi:hypothetical protein